MSRMCRLRERRPTSSHRSAVARRADAHGCYEQPGLLAEAEVKMSNVFLGLTARSSTRILELEQRIKGTATFRQGREARANISRRIGGFQAKVESFIRTGQPGQFEDRFSTIRNSTRDDDETTSCPCAQGNAKTRGDGRMIIDPYSRPLAFRGHQLHPVVHHRR